MKFSEPLTAATQIILSVVFIHGYFSIFRMFLTGEVDIPLNYKELVQGMFTLLTGTVLLIVQFWFMRTRPDTKPPG